MMKYTTYSNRQKGRFDMKSLKEGNVYS